MKEIVVQWAPEYADQTLGFCNLSKMWISAVNCQSLSFKSHRLNDVKNSEGSWHWRPVQKMTGCGSG